MLKIKDIHKSFGGVKALRGCSFEIEKNKIIALIGPNGAGKTTLLDVVSGLLKPDSGSILMGDYDLTKMRPHAIANLGVSRTFQQVRLFKNLTILDHWQMAENNQDTHLFRQIFARNKVDRKKYETTLEEFGIKKKLDDRIAGLSYGQRKLLQMAMAFLKPHALLLLDEPVAGVNQVVQREIEGLLLKFKKQGKTIVIIEHDINFVKKLADRVIVMDEGRVLAEGAPEEVLARKDVLEAYLGE